MTDLRLHHQATTLYRFYDSSDALLYVGITNCVPRRFDQHSERKPWFTKATRITLEHYPSRASALEAEKAAIVAEKPRYNIRHNGERARPLKAGGRWRFETRRYGTRRQADLWLYPELDCSSMVDDYYDLDGEGQLAAYVGYLEHHHPEWLERDAVPILWTVSGDGCEFAPFRDLWAGEFAPEGDFLTYFTWPHDAKTGESLDWFQLPVRNDRFPEFAEALAWTPSPFQPACPIRSILASRDGLLPARRTRRWTA